MTQGWDKAPNQSPEAGASGADQPTAGYVVPDPGQPAVYPPTTAYPVPDQPAWARQAHAQGTYQPVDPGYPAPGYPPAGYVPSGPPQPSYPQVGYGQPGYPQPVQPGAGYPPPSYPPSGYPAPGYQQPGYQQPGYPPAGYGQPGYSPAGYPVGQGRPKRPGVITAASVLAFIQGGLLVIAGIATLSGGSALNDLDIGVGGVVGGVLTVMGVATLVSAGLLIAGGVSAFNNKPWLMVAGATLSLVLSVWWVVQFDLLGVVLTWSLLLAVMPIISLSLILGSTAKTWMTAQNAP